MYFQTFHTDDTSFFNGNFSDASQGRFVIAAFLPEIMTDSLALPSLKIDASLPFANLTSTTSYIHRNVRVTSDQSAWLGAGIGGFGSPLGPGFPTSPSDVTPSLFGNEVKGITQEVRLASNQKDAFFAWVAGIYFDHRTQDDIQWDSSASQPGGTVVNMAEHTLDDQIAAYVQGDFRVTSKLTATLGERVAKVNSHLNNYVGPGVFDVGIPPTSSTSLKETPNTPRVALSYQANDNNLFYISASKGFRIGGGNMPVPTNLGCTSAAPATYSSDYLWSYEVGAKNTFFDGRLQINSSVFHVAWYNIQQLVYLACLAGYIGNAGNAVSNGFDLALQGVVTQELRVALDVGYANAYYSSNVLDGAGNPLVLAGDKIGFLPQVNAPWNVNATVTYEIPLPNGDNIQLRGDHQYNSQNPGPFVSQIPKSPSYWPSLEPNPPTQVTNIRMGYTRGELNVAVFVNNVFNSTPLLSKFTITPTTNLVGYTTLRPRTTGVSANYKF
jgi:outer membrane receptor protein involved in Fe transport